MVKASKLQYEYRRGLNRVNSGFSKRISIVDGDSFLNAAKDLVFENFAAVFQRNKTVRAHLRQLETGPIPLEVASKEIYSSVNLPDDFYMSTKHIIKICNEKCDGDIRLAKVKKLESSDVPLSLKSSFWKPSWEYSTTFMEEMGNQFLIYHDKKFDICYVELTYIRKPKDIATPSLLKNECESCTYVNSDGETISEDIDFEIDSSYFWRKVVDLAVLETLRSLGEVQDYQMKLQSILTLDKIFIN